MKATGPTQNPYEADARPFRVSAALFLIIATINITATVCSLLVA